MIRKSELNNFKTFVNFIEQAIYGKRVRTNKHTNKVAIEKPNEQVALVKEKQGTENIPTIDTKPNEIKENTESQTQRKIFSSNNKLPKEIIRSRQFGHKTNS